jgi:hypothetical protein
MILSCRARLGRADCYRGDLRGCDLKTPAVKSLAEVFGWSGCYPHVAILGVQCNGLSIGHT